MGSFMGFLTALWAYIVLSAPYLLIGFFASGLVNEYFNMEWIKKNLGLKGIKSILKASIFGVPLPLCSCAVIPAAVTLKKQGASNAATSSFLISTPESGVDSIMMTYGVMDLPMTIMRPIAAFITAFFAGLGQHFFNQEPVMPAEETKSCCSKSKVKPAATFSQRAKRFWHFSTQELVDDVAVWLSVGLLCGALINYAVPQELFMAGNAWWGRLTILAVGIPFYICASASTPIAASMMMKGMSPGSALIFLLVGPATNVANLAVLQKYIGKKGIIINIIAIAIVSLALSFVVDGLYQHFSWPFEYAVEAVHQHGATWWQNMMAIAFLVLLGGGLFRTLVRPLYTGEEGHSH